jgi:putative transposase
MNVHLENLVPRMSDFVVIAHRPKYNRVMKRLQAYKYELQPNGEQQRPMRRFAGSCRFVFNKALAMQEANHAMGGPLWASTWGRRSDCAGVGSCLAP